MKTLHLLQSSAASPNGRMTWLTRLVLALVILAVAPSMAMAENWNYYLAVAGSKTNETYKNFGNTSNPNDHVTWSVRATGAELNEYATNGNIYFYIKVNNYYLRPGSATTYNIGDAGSVSSANSSASYNSFTLNLGSHNTADDVYVFTFNSDGNGGSDVRNNGTIKVTLTSKDYFSLSYRGTSEGTLQTSSANDFFTFTISEAVYDENAKGNGLEFTLGKSVSALDKSIGTYYGSVTSTSQKIDNNTLVSIVNGHETTFFLNSDLGDVAPAGNITVSVNIGSSNQTYNGTTIAPGQFLISYTEKQSVEAKDLYLMLRKQGGNGKWYAHKMQWSRNRQLDNTNTDKGEVNDKYQNLNFKADDLSNYLGGQATDDNTTVEWYVRSGAPSSGSTAYTYYYPTSTTDLTTSGEQPIAQGSYINSNRVITPSVNTNEPNAYYTFKKGIGVSYTFTANKTAASGGAQIGFAANKSIEDKGSYYLLGDFTANNTQIDINNHSYPMTRYYYYGGVGYNDTQWATFNATETHVQDSIVYRVTVSKPALGWGNLYIMPNPAGNTDWGSVLRPQINLGVAGLDDTKAYQIDGTALKGGLTNVNRSQSLNPKMEDALAIVGVQSVDDITSYDFSMNLTTATYRLVFNKIVGDGEISLRDYGDVKYKGQTRNISGLGEHQYFRTYYSSDSYVCPKNVNMYVISSIDKTDDATTVNLKKINNKCQISDDTYGTITYIPANTALIITAAPSYTLGSEDDKVMWSSHTEATTLNDYEDDDAKTTVQYFGIDETTGKNAKSGNSLNELVFSAHRLAKSIALPADISTSPYFVGTNEELPLTKSYTYTEGGKTKTGYNYLFSFYKHSKWSTEPATLDNQFDLGFWLSNGTNKTYANSAYIHYPGYMVEKTHVGTTYSIPSEAASAKAAPALFINWGTDDDSTITGITDVTKSEVVSGVDNWYTIQGMHVAKPTVRGIYIHNGKKVIVK